MINRADTIAGIIDESHEISAGLGIKGQVWIDSADRSVRTISGEGQFQVFDFLVFRYPSSSSGILKS
ncbi:MAG: hypothetical protein V3V52_13765 [Candidatus Adiutricales bacterium]